ncbi:hypothetical protein BDZ97DRAFT_1814425 [Flammula alnicola]|nr:hypothetical protein BDZ97DRAFT_1814425 [Flammula alnicola]
MRFKLTLTSTNRPCIGTLHLFKATTKSAVSHGPHRITGIELDGNPFPGIDQCHDHFQASTTVAPHTRLSRNLAVFLLSTGQWTVNFKP